MKRYQFAAYTWTEVHEMERGDIIILIPLGSTEQEGSHLPIGVDTYVAEAIAQAVAKETDCLVGPTLPVGYSEWFLEVSRNSFLLMAMVVILLQWILFPGNL
jgi:creatinine amidohydrolase/Fe(II)-dependent formamide hydrolase-like protein